MPLYRVDFSLGMTIVNAPRLATAKNWAVGYFGTHNGPYGVKEAKQEDLDWNKAMGGEINVVEFND